MAWRGGTQVRLRLRRRVGLVAALRRAGALTWPRIILATLLPARRRHVGLRRVRVGGVTGGTACEGQSPVVLYFWRSLSAGRGSQDRTARASRLVRRPWSSNACPPYSVTACRFDHHPLPRT